MPERSQKIHEDMSQLKITPDEYCSRMCAMIDDFESYKIMPQLDDILTEKKL